MLQITTVVDSNVAEYKFLQEVLLLNKWTILKVEQEGQENCQSVLTSPFPLWNLDSQRLSFHSVWEDRKQWGLGVGQRRKTF